MEYNFKSSFKNCFQKLSFEKQELIHEAIKKLKLFYETRQNLPGMGLKNLRKNYWEIRASLKDRILFSIQDNVISFILVGNHDSIRKFLKNV